MAKLNMATPFDSNKGKYAKTDQIYFKTRRFDEQVIGVRQKHPTTNEPPTAGQQAVQAQFATVAAQVKNGSCRPDAESSAEDGVETAEEVQDPHGLRLPQDVLKS